MTKLWWLIEKDLLTEYRARRVWPAMLLFGIVVALVFSLQMELLPAQKHQLVGGFLWIATVFAGLLAIDRSFVSEREAGCWDALLLYPVSRTSIYLAKLVVNIGALATLQCVLIPLIILLSDVPLLEHPWEAFLVAILGNVGIASVGTLLSALAAGLPRSSQLLSLLVLPLVIPVVLAATQATCLLAEASFGPDWWRWIQLLGVFAVVFALAGLLLFDFVVED